MPTAGQGISGKRARVPAKELNIVLPRSKRRASGSSLKPLHVARLQATYEIDEDHNLASVVPVAYSAEQEYVPAPK